MVLRLLVILLLLMLWLLLRVLLLRIAEALLRVVAEAKVLLRVVGKSAGYVEVGSRKTAVGRKAVKRPLK